MQFLDLKFNFGNLEGYIGVRKSSSPKDYITLEADGENYKLTLVYKGFNCTIDLTKI